MPVSTSFTQFLLDFITAQKQVVVDRISLLIQEGYSTFRDNQLFAQFRGLFQAFEDFFRPDTVSLPSQRISGLSTSSQEKKLLETLPSIELSDLIQDENTIQKKSVPSYVGILQHMNFLQSQVMEGIRNDRMKRLDQDEIPAIQKMFTLNGQNNLSVEEKAVIHAIRETNKDIISQQAKVGYQGYCDALQVLHQNFIRKLESLLELTIQGLLENGIVRTGALESLFQKGVDCNELVEILIETKAYNEPKDIEKVNREFSESKRQLLNISATSHVLNDMGLAKNLAKKVIKMLEIILLGSEWTGYSAVGLPGSIGAVIITNAVFFILANEKFINQVRTYARIHQQGNDRYADTLMKRILPIIVSKTIRIEKRIDVP